ncbi:MAG: tryptophan synthase subunit alpha [Candidatus Omnitrophica bacterium]|nr:tryptophan synthase subunit alpha [Candidatus Omnitrophota bacterium]
MTIKEKFQELKKQGRKAFVAYVPYGFPTIAKTRDIIIALQEAGVDIIELGIPFSDPVADGAVIQEAASIALKNGANTKNLFDTLNRIKKDIKVPVALMTYYNPVFRFGVEDFFKSMNEAGVSGILTVDLPIDEASEYLRQAKKHKIETVFFITPVTPISRAKKILKASKGFLYYISVTGTTGVREISYDSLSGHIKQLKKETDLPVCVGFGVHTKEQFKNICKFSDGAIIGSAIVKFIKENHTRGNFLNSFKNYVRSLRAEHN